MNVLDKMLNFGSTFRLLLFVAASITFSIYIIKNPDQKTGAWAILFIGLAGIAQEYRTWRDNRRTKNGDSAIN